MSVITQEPSEQVFREHKKHVLHNVECGACITALTAATAVYTDSIVAMVFTGAFVFVELYNAFDYLKLCTQHRKDITH